jgi:hypothetical protein
LADFDGAIECYDLFRTHSRSESGHNIFGQRCQSIAKMDDSANSMRIFNGAMLSRINKFCEEIAGKHGLYEPNGPPLSHSLETQTGREAFDAKLTPERRGSQMLSLWLRH